MPHDDSEIRGLIERWASAVHNGDLDTVLADHADDIVMFDVPPPYDGVRGLDAYRQTWPPFFEWQAGVRCSRSNRSTSLPALRLRSRLHCCAAEASGSWRRTRYCASA